MDIERAKELFERDVDRDKDPSVDQEVCGLQLIRALLDGAGRREKAISYVNHDMLYSISLDRAIECGLTEEHIDQLMKWSWFIDCDTDRLATFV